ncbi:MAG: hypothetical protein AVO38_05910 [delta proteobacterium ML8_D]|nr:MAG: hypothetical protein AVO38_05910 [delta proteobacterium ML8_D]
MKSCVFLTTIFLLFIIVSSASASYPLPCSVPLPNSKNSAMCDWRVEGSYNLKYYSNFNLRIVNESITRAVISVHGRRAKRGDDRPYDYYEHIVNAAISRGQANNTLVIAPYFSRSRTDEFNTTLNTWQRVDNPRCGGNPALWGISSDDRLCWSAWDGNDANDYPYGGNADNDPDYAYTASFALIDDIIDWLATSGNFPNLDVIIVTGQSAGGQFTIRYALAGAAEPEGITIRYVPTNPGSVPYLGAFRPTQGAKDKFPNILYQEDCDSNGMISADEVSAPPSPSAAVGTLFPNLHAWAFQECLLSLPAAFEWEGVACYADGSYDIWPWGLADVDSANDYLASNVASASEARSRYISRNVVLVYGIEDNIFVAPNFPCEDGSVWHCPHATQGDTRLEIGTFFFNNVCLYDCSKHGFATVAADRDGDGDLDPIGHGGYWIYRSEATRSILFDDVKPPSIKGQKYVIPAVPDQETLVTFGHLIPSTFSEGSSFIIEPGEDYIYRCPGPKVSNAFYVRPDHDFTGELTVPIRVVSPIPNAPLHRYFTSNRYYLRLQVPGIIPDIKVNGENGPLSLEQTDSLTLSLSLQNNGITANSDWWLATVTPVGIGFWTIFSGWTTSLMPAYSGPLFALDRFGSPAIPLLGFPSGLYTFYFGIDMNTDGNINLESLYFDTAVVYLAK